MKELYSKHKDRDPQDTVDSIVEMLEQAGLDTEMRWTSHPFEGLCSNRVTIAGTSIGTNGKGTSEQYCLASGYAEFMEHLQNNILGNTALSGAVIFERRGFLAAPDERYATPAEIEARHDPVLEEWLATLGVATHKERVELLERLLSMDYARGDGTVAELPFAAPAAEDDGAPRILWLLAALVYRICGSNGMAAGNTLKEALVQGLSEIFERYAEAQVLRGEAVPPRVPDEALEATGLMPTIARIQEGGRYEVRVRDASHLGFPSCQILVPGMSEVFAPTGDLRKGLLDTIRAKEALRQFPSLGKEEQRELLAIKPHDLAHALPGVFDLPFLGGKMHPCRVYGFLQTPSALRSSSRARTTRACRCFAPMAQRTKLFVTSKPWESLTDGGRTLRAARSRCRSRSHQKTARRASWAPSAAPTASS